MVKKYLKFLFLFLTTGVFIVSCNHKAKRNSERITFDSVQLNKTVYLLGDTALPSCNINIRYTYPVTKDSVLKDSIDFYLIQSCFGDDYVRHNYFNSLSAEALIQLYAKNYTDNYLKDVQPLYVEELKEHPQDKSESFGWFSYYEEIISSIVYQNKSLLVYSCYLNEFTGGAHGVYFTNYINFDLDLMRPLHLNDIFVGDYKDAVSDQIWNALMKKENVKSRDALEEMGYGTLGDIEPIENFYLTPEGITFHYNIYEIAPFSMGAISVTVPFNQVSRWLNTMPLLRELMK